MEEKMKEIICTASGVIGSLIAGVFGGWTAGMTTLIIFMGIDYVSGLIVAGVFNNSTKTVNGALESKAGWKGLFRKGMTLVIVLVAHRIDIMVGATYVRDGVIIAFVANEAISIIENAGLMGIKMPKILTKAIDVLKGKAEQPD